MNRRSFLEKTAAAGAALAFSSAWETPASVGEAASAFGRGGVAPLIVVQQSLDADQNPRARAWSYIEEVLQRAGLFFTTLRVDQLKTIRPHTRAVVLLAGDLRLSAAHRDLLTDWVQRGGALLGVGGASGLEELFGVAGCTPSAEGWIKTTVTDHPVTRGLRSSLHVFGGCSLKPGKGAALADLTGAKEAKKGSAIVEHAAGQGKTLVVGPDLLFSIVHIQQGIPVFQDGRPAPDGSAELNETTLKAEDGLVLDWQRDRQPAEPDKSPIFLEPVTDELRELILRGVFHLATAQKVALPVLWYWPRALPAVALLSHDTDGNNPALAEALLAVVNRAGVKSTWCILYPGGYPREFYRQLDAQQYEIGLHYDAFTGGADTSWAKANFQLQHAWLKHEAGVPAIFSNKNHYTRWEGRLDLLRWLEETGVGADQTRGPSKKGTIGFPLGGSQPYFPLDDECGSPRRLKVMEINLLTQDHVVTCPPEYGPQLADAVLRHHGVGHFLFHPAHIQKPRVADTLLGLVAHVQSRGMEWWTCRQITSWENRRRSWTAEFEPSGRLQLRGDGNLDDATLLFLRVGAEPARISISGATAHPEKFTAYGFDFDAVRLDLHRRTSLQVV